MGIVKSLWVGSPLSSQEILSIRSFIANGHEYHLYVYDDVGPVPAGAVLKDASEILGREHAHKDKLGTYGFLSDRFRYRLLLAQGGWWVDTDVICVRPFEVEDDYFFCGETAEMLANTVMKVPPASQLMAVAEANAFAVDEHLSWGLIGPYLMTKALEHPMFQPLRRFIRPPEAIFPFPHTRWQDIFFKEYDEVAAEIPAGTYGIHLSNQMIRWTRDAANKKDSNLDPDRLFPANTVYGHFQRKYL